MVADVRGIIMESPKISFDRIGIVTGGSAERGRKKDAIGGTGVGSGIVVRCGV